MINLDNYKSLGTQWIALYLNENNAIYFDRFSFRVRTFPKRLKYITKNNITKIFI